MEYLFDIPYTVTFNQGRKLATIDLIHLDDILNKTFWQNLLQEDFGVLLTVLKMMKKYDNPYILKSIVMYYFSDSILRTLSYLPEYINYPKLAENQVEEDFIKDDLWQAHITYLNNLREIGRTTLNNHKIKTRYMVNSIKTQKDNIHPNEFRQLMKELISNHPEVVTEILKFVPQVNLNRTIGKEKLIKVINETKNQLAKLEQSSRILASGSGINSTREAVYYVHMKFRDELPKFAVIRHLLDTTTMEEANQKAIYKALNNIIKLHITSLNELEYYLKNTINPKEFEF